MEHNNKKKIELPVIKHRPVSVWAYLIEVS